MTILETKNLKKYYGKGDTQVKALDGVNLSVEDGEFVAIVGTSGSGKSTLLRCINLLETPTSGEILFHDKKSSGQTSFSAHQNTVIIAVLLP